MRFTPDLSESIAFADTVRVVLVYVGVALALMMVKVGYRAAHRRDWERVAECTSFAAAILTPDAFMIQRFGHPLHAATWLYVVALVAGLTWAVFRVRFRSRWLSMQNRYTDPAHRAPTVRR